MKLDLSKPVRLRNPQEGEEHLTFMVRNYNEDTQRVYIEPINSRLALNSEELVSVEDICNIE
jgi:hypothetical protein